jgi:hypothetical protein
MTERDYDFPARFFGTLAPFFRASESPIAIACFLLLTFRPEVPLLSVPALRFFMARLTLSAASLEYFRFFAFFAIAAILTGFDYPDWNSAFGERFISSMKTLRTASSRKGFSA